MPYHEIAEEARKRYDRFAKASRAIDASTIDQELRSHYGKIITLLCRPFSRPIPVLALGCAPGRYFHFLDNVQKLIGIDASSEMLKEARQPIHQEQINIPHTELICGDFSAQAFPAESFDLIYSIGVMGEYAPLDKTICQKLNVWLKPGGKLFFSVVDAASKPSTQSLKRHIAEGLYPVLPAGWKSKIRQDKLWRSLYLTETQLKEILKAGDLSDVTINRFGVEATDGWVGAHFDCFTTKPVASNQQTLQYSASQKHQTPLIEP